MNLGECLPDDDLMDSLKDGTVLCRLLNVVTPGSTKYKVSKMPFVQVATHAPRSSLIADGEYRKVP